MDTNKLCELYVNYSYLYYIEDASPVPDSYYDSICAQLLEVIEDIPEQYRSIIDAESMKASTGYHITLEDYERLSSL